MQNKLLHNIFLLYSMLGSAVDYVEDNETETLT